MTLCKLWRCIYYNMLAMSAHLWYPARIQDGRKYGMTQHQHETHNVTCVTCRACRFEDAFPSTPYDLVVDTMGGDYELRR